MRTKRPHLCRYRRWYVCFPSAARSITISKDKISKECIDLGFVASFEQTNTTVAEAAKRVTEKRYLEQISSITTSLQEFHIKK